MIGANQPTPQSRVGQEGLNQNPCPPIISSAVPTSGQAPIGTISGPAALAIKVARRHLSAEENGTENDVFAITLGDQTIPLLPFRNWGQLDLFKWTVQGKLPGTPAGLEVTPDHVKIAGETVLIGDPDGCLKLEKAFSDWLLLEQCNLESLRKRRQAKPSSPATDASAAVPGAIHYAVEVDKRGQVHVKCLRGDELLSAVGLTAQGFNGLFAQGLMRKPRMLEIGALHDWVELDGELCSFEHGTNDSAKLEKLLNEKYVPANVLGHGKDIVISANAASPTGFDVQFPVAVGGVPENRRRTLNDAALELLLEPTRCGLLQPGLIVKISPPNLIFKRKTVEGGEAYLAKSAENIVTISGDDGRERLIDLSQPVNYTRLGLVEMTAIFNHPAVNRHSKPATTPGPPSPLPAKPTRPPAGREDRPLPTPAPAPPLVPTFAPVVSRTPPPPIEAASAAPIVSAAPLRADSAKAQEKPPAQKQPALVNAWLAPLIAAAPIRFDWLSSLLYARIAERFGNSREANIGLSSGWAVALGDVTDPEDPCFTGVFLTHKGGFGFLGPNAMLRFHRGVIFVGSRVSVLEGIGVDLIAVGLDERSQLVFIVSDGFQSKFDIADRIVALELSRVCEAGATVQSRSEVGDSSRALELVWTVPAEQADPLEPEALETSRPSA